jgi:hypothetical protein
MRLNNFLLVSAAALVAAPLSAQIPPLLPYTRTVDMLVVDSSFDGVWRLSDLNQDGDYNDAGEVTVYYSDASGIALTNPTCITVADDGTAYIADSTVDIVLALRDLNGDGDANDPGEFTQVFTSNGPGGITMASAQGLTVDALGRVYVAVSNAGSPPVGSDMILRLEDLNGDQDFDDLGEAAIYASIPGSSTTLGTSIPTKVVVTATGDLLYTEVGTTAALPKGIYRLADTNLDGDASDPGEWTPVWTPVVPSPGFATTPFFWSLALDWTGVMYTAEYSANENVWRIFDADFSGTIDPSEATIFYHTSASTWWDVIVREDGAILLVEAENPDRITRLIDGNADNDALDAGEAVEIYDSSVAAQAISVRGAALMRAPSLSMIPATTQVGTSSNYTIRTTRPFDLVVPALSLVALPPFSLPPFGFLEIDPINGVLLSLGIADAQCNYSTALTLPNNPVFIGTYATQALCGDLFRLYLTNGASLTLTP